MKNKFPRRFELWFAIAGAICFFNARLCAQTNFTDANALPKLSPPFDKLPPTFWEQHGILILVGGLGTILLLAFGCWLIFRPKPKIVIPPEVQARQSLEMLRPQPETGAVLSRISQIVRNYFIAAFQLVPGEYTTIEFSRALSNCEKINAELALAAVDFLHDCDAQKFSAANAAASLNAAKRALALVEQAEQRRAEFRQLAETQKQERRA
jgi:hypothetical protein